MTPDTEFTQAEAGTRTTGEAVAGRRCIICGHVASAFSPSNQGSVRGNTARYGQQLFHLWKCDGCLSIHSLDPVDFENIYADYPLNKRQADAFAKHTLGNLLSRLVAAGLKPDHSILDYGCGNGIFVQFLKGRGYHHVTGFDPYVPEFAAQVTGRSFDCVVVNDVLEHVPDPRALIQQCAALVRPRGLLYVGTADSEPVNMQNLEPHVMRLHQPFHRTIITQDGLVKLAKESGFDVLKTFRRSYMDTRWPFANYRFLDEFNKAVGHDMDRALDPSSWTVVFRKPSLMIYAFLGYLWPSAFEPAVILKNSSQSKVS